jgi:SAM-dependent methyltransferase
MCQKLNVKEGEIAIDVACGRGRHAQVLANQGLDTVGLDLSPESISYANQFAHEGLDFLVGNMLEPFEVPEADWVFNLFTSFGYFENDAMHARAISNMAGALKPGGKLVLDYMNAKKIATQLVPEDTVQTALAQYKITRQIEGDSIVKSISFEEPGCNILQFEERVRAFELHELKTFMEAAGLRVLDQHGDYDLSPFSPDESDRLIIIAQKPLLS